MMPGMSGYDVLEEIRRDPLIAAFCSDPKKLDTKVPVLIL
jgi:CheY-like chemotaxis protein